SAGSRDAAGPSAPSTAAARASWAIRTTGPTRSASTPITVGGVPRSRPSCRGDLVASGLAPHGHQALRTRAVGAPVEPPVQRDVGQTGPVHELAELLSRVEGVLETEPLGLAV